VVGSEKNRLMIEVCELLQLMLKMSSLCTHTGSQTQTPLFDSLVDDALIKATPFLRQPLSQMIHASDPTRVDSLL